ncbi:MAG TPA: DUF4912 domain-containing protein [Anaeromyxobacteraceae bacterium]|nr:DUF4912 domain-containing protein [Anaeromyxobacteraceae bacterium]
MAKLETMTVEALRKLARRVLGAAAARLQGKKALLAALRGAGAAPAGGKAPRREAAAAPRGGAGRAEGFGRPGKKASARKAAPKAKGARAAGAPKAGAAPGLDPEAYFVARVRGEDAARAAPHPMTEAAVEAAKPSGVRELGEPEGAVPDEGLGELPWSYGDDALVALPRDPRTLFLYWDFAPAVVAAALSGLEGGRTQLWVFARGGGGGLERVRTLEFALEARSFYVHDLTPGRAYLAEVHAVDGRGRERRLGGPSNEVMLPPVGPSALVDDRFARIPWDLPLSRWLKDVLRGGPFSEELRALLARLSDWSRFAGRAWGGSAGGMGGRPVSPSGGPSSPPGPFRGGEGD